MAATLAGWHEVYVTVGAAAGTLVGLLFVGLSLHIRVVVAHAEVRSLARVTLTASPRCCWWHRRPAADGQRSGGS